MQKISTTTALNWAYQATSPNKSALEDWASIADLTLLHDPHLRDSFRSGRWNTTSNPDLDFANLTSTLPQRLVLDPFPRSQLHLLPHITQLNLFQQRMLRDVTSTRPNGNNLHTW